MNEFAKARLFLQDTRRAELRLQELIERKVSWSDAEDVREYRRDQRRADRQAVLDELVPDRRCPVCRRVFLALKAWVVHNREFACCRGCRDGDPVESASSCFGDPVVRVPIDGGELRRLREVRGISQSAFAEAVGWSQSYQSRLESGETKSVLLAQAEAIERVLTGENT